MRIIFYNANKSSDNFVENKNNNLDKLKIVIIDSFTVNGLMNV